MSHDYFYGAESDSFSFYRVPRLLVTGEEYKRVSAEAKLLYGLLLDRMGLSARNGWYDELDRVYIYYTVEEIQEDLCCGHVKAGRLLAELDSKNGVGLIERVKQGQGKPTKIYVKQFTSSSSGDKNEQSRPTKTVAQDSSKREVKTAHFDTSRPTNCGCADIHKPDASYNNIIYTDLSYTEPSIVRKPLNGSHRRERQCEPFKGFLPLKLNPRRKAPWALRLQQWIR